MLAGFRHQILGIDADTAQVWGRLRVPDPAHKLDKLIAATALVHDLTVVTRNVGRLRSGIRAQAAELVRGVTLRQR